MLKLLPKIIQFLGYVPDIFSIHSFGEKIMTYRIVRGLSRKELANQIGIDPSTLGRYEKDQDHPKGKIKEKINYIVNF